jgi:REP element-mobilizing transposase RayT
MEKALRERKSIGLPNRAYVGRQMYFVTVCCHSKSTVLSEARLCTRILDLLGSEAKSRQFAIAAYCFMPDHLHFLAEGLDARRIFFAS